MSKKRKACTYEEKLQAVEDYLSGKKNQKQIAVELGLGKRGRSTIGVWVRQYQESGAESLLPCASRKTYSGEFKLQVVQEYLKGEGSTQALAIKYGIPNKSTVLSWIKKYNSHEKLESTPVATEVHMTKSKRKVSIEECIEIVQYCIRHGLDYAKTAEFFDLTYWQVYNWVQKYNDKGEEGLVDRRGRRKSEDELDETEKLRRRVKQLERELEEERLRSELLKKVQEVERRRYSPKGN